jgi:hypothetical protein
VSSIPADRSSILRGASWRKRSLGVEASAEAGAVCASFGGAVRKTTDTFVSSDVLSRFCSLAFTVTLADTESHCLAVSSHEEVEEVSSVPVSGLF